MLGSTRFNTLILFVKRSGISHSSLFTKLFYKLGDCSA